MRLFLAIELHDAVRRELTKTVARWTEFRRQVRFVSPEQMHLTVKFLGDTPDEFVPDLCRAAESAAVKSSPCTWTVDRCGCFPSAGRVRVIWAGGPDTPEGLQQCVDECELRFEDLGYDRETRPFTAHVTLGRVRDRSAGEALRKAVETTPPRPVEQEIRGLTVFQSVLGSQGATYHAVGRYPFGGSG